MIKYRPQRGGLDEAMAEAREFATYEDMKQYIVQGYAEWNHPFGVDDIVIGENIGNDDRIGWKNVRHVCTKRWGGHDYIQEYGCPQCIGWCGE